ncbi:hypothetical protein [Halalkalicoccus salilacus]|uniref:hypothetical protein n=1 Tax=Halalkalicoccus TaxID=332246 RepID=UPI002F96AA94
MDGTTDVTTGLPGRGGPATVDVRDRNRNREMIEGDGGLERTVSSVGGQELLPFQ